jgi:hypothetical protein
LLAYSSTNPASLGLNLLDRFLAGIEVRLFGGFISNTLRRARRDLHHLWDLMILHFITASLLGASKRVVVACMTGIVWVEEEEAASS